MQDRGFEEKHHCVQWIYINAKQILEQRCQNNEVHIFKKIIQWKIIRKINKSYSY